MKAVCGKTAVELGVDNFGTAGAVFKYSWYSEDYANTLDNGFRNLDK